MMSDASEMLAAALEQMDGIIAGSKAMDYSNGLFDCQSPTSPFLGSLRALHLLEDLRAALEMMDQDEREGLRCQVPDTTADGLVEWLQQGQLTNGNGSAMIYQERLSRVESDKECLVLQVSVLSDQVEVQGEKIRDLDMCLEEHREKLDATEETLQQELLSRSTLETQKLELMTEVSSLKLKLTTVARDLRDSEELYQEVNDLRFRVTDMENERLQCEKKLKSTKEELQTLQRQLEELRRLKDQATQGVLTPDRTDGEKDVDVLRMKRAMESLTSANNDKDRRIEELQESITRYKKVQDLVKDTLNEDDYDDIQDDRSPSIQVAMDTDRATLAVGEETGRSCDEIPSIAVFSELKQESLIQEPDTDSPPEVPPHSVGSLGHINSNTEQTTVEEPSPPSNPSSNESFGTKKARSSFGRGFFKMRGGKRTSSAPNLDRSRSASAPTLAETERKGTDHLDLAGAPPHKPQGGDSSQTLPSSPEAKKKSKGFMKFLGRLKRSHSTSLDPEETEFRRGGVRATAGPRLGWSRDLQHSADDVDAPFAQWSKEQVCVWLQEQGLGLHVAQAQQWIRSGFTLLQASQHDLEKELGIKQPLHRKKLQLALQALGSEEDVSKAKLDHNWVTRWLDDIGLPQYKSQFDEGRVDGRMLHYMTVDDLLSLKVGSVLHHLSIKRAIQVLRLNFYEPNCLRRRPSDEKMSPQNNITPGEISQWTNHRVMEWLRSVDLAEYAPNLRGSGVHGGVMVLEPRFNVESLALLLNIPPNKTLLRRHLATHFHLLIGSAAQRSKQECLENPDYTLLTATAKVKPRRLPFGGFGTLRKKRQEDSEEYVCPMDVEMPKNSSFQGDLRIYEDNLDQMEDSEGAVRQIGAFSEEIDNLTSMLKEDEFFSEVSSRSPEASVTDDDSNV
ncbi:liprin-beta-1 isoform X1 [Oncorhynchus mykiss]|uniref:liprin-beta-1 isoform X1 n=1 Tax=Oncorhynchus mykiss TaxID=8022 RepID=UPI001878E491|nr:liprin-beta-1 isoform X1 [Oncorhynchus mykiss]XP_036813182.1 liprin-beta-1 isoform X1 [Oncorhynchus mykiss]